MTYLHIKFIVVTTVAFISTFPSLASAYCDVQKTPLTNAGRCEEYMKLDRNLNERYKKLMSDVDPDTQKRLRNVQRQWIQWRDEKCEEVQEISGCNGNGSCNGVAHDYCVIDLTRQRYDELNSIQPHDRSIKENDLLFSKEYK